MSSHKWDGPERRSVVSQEEQLGYIRGKVEGTQAELSEFKDDMKAMMESHIEKEERRDELFMEKIDKLTFELTVYKRVFQGLVAIVLATLSFVFNDLIKWFKG